MGESRLAVQKWGAGFSESPECCYKFLHRDRYRQMSNESLPTARVLNTMTDAEKIEFARSPFMRQLQVTAGTYVTTFRWSYVHATLGTQRWRNGSAFLIDINGRIIAVTAAHVYRLYLEGKQMARGRIACHSATSRSIPKAD
jgi:hypothetical protein